MKFRFWRKPKRVETPKQTIIIPAGKYTVGYKVQINGKQINRSTAVYPTVTKEDK